VSAKGDGRYVISNGKDQALRLWDLRKMRTNAEYEEVAHDHYGIRNYDYRCAPCFRPLVALYLIVNTIIFQVWAIPQTQSPSASLRLQCHEVQRARRAPDPHTMSLQSCRDDWRAVHLLRVC